MGAIATPLRVPRIVMFSAIALSLSCEGATAPGVPNGNEPPGAAPPPVAPPTPSPLPPASGPLQPTPPFPAAVGAVAIYVGPEDLYSILAQLHGSKLLSRFVFFGDSTFELQYSSYRFGILKYPGRVLAGDTLLTLDFAGYRDHGPATASVRDSTLEVKYSLWMQMSDFLDGVYTRQR